VTGERKEGGRRWSPGEKGRALKVFLGPILGRYRSQVVTYRKKGGHPEMVGSCGVPSDLSLGTGSWAV